MDKNFSDFDKPDAEGKTGLIHAIQSKNRRVVVYLLEDKADVNASDSSIFQKTPLHYAAENEDLATCILLMMNRADHNIADKEGNLPGAGLLNGKVRMFLDDVTHP